MYNRRQNRRFFSIPNVTFLMFEFSVGARGLQWVRVFSGCASSVGASFQGCQSLVGASFQWVRVFSGCEFSWVRAFSGCESSAGASLHVSGCQC
jgi:hypothetical protein